MTNGGRIRFTRFPTSAFGIGFLISTRCAHSFYFLPYIQLLSVSRPERIAYQLCGTSFAATRRACLVTSNCALFSALGVTHKLSVTSCNVLNMSLKCGKCDIELNSNDCVKCVECATYFHPACTRLGSSKNVTKAKTRNWKCDQCKGDSASVKSNEDIGDELSSKSILDALHAIRTDINSNIDKKVGEMRSSIDALTDSIQKLNTKLSLLESAQQQISVRCDQLERDRDDQRDDVRELRIRVLDAEQHSRCSNIEIKNMPYTKNENVYDILAEISVVLGLSSHKREDISVAHRLRLYSRKLEHPPIIIQFVSRSVKEMWLTAARNRRGFNAREVSASLPSVAVYINDHLTSHNKMLLGRARRLQKQGKISLATISNGKVLIKPTDKDNVTRVHFVEDLDRYDK